MSLRPMEILKMIKYIALIVSLAFTIKVDANDSVLDQINELNLLEKKLKKDYQFSLDKFTANQVSEASQGCLDNISNIDISMISMDPSSMWQQAYKQIKDKIINQACSAVQDELAKQLVNINDQLELPYGLGSINIGTSSGANTWNSAIDNTPKLTEAEVENEVQNEVYNSQQPFTPIIAPASTHELDSNTDNLRNTGGERPKPLEEIRKAKKTGVIQLDTIFSSKKKDKSEGEQ